MGVQLSPGIQQDISVVDGEHHKKAGYKKEKLFLVKSFHKQLSS